VGCWHSPNLFVFCYFVFFLFSGIWIGEVHLQNWNLNGLLGNEMDTKCQICHFHTCPKTQRSQCSFLKKNKKNSYITWKNGPYLVPLSKQLSPEQSKSQRAMDCTYRTTDCTCIHPLYTYSGYYICIYIYIYMCICLNIYIYISFIYVCYVCINIYICMNMFPVP